MEDQLTRKSPGSAIDIYLFVAHLQLTTADLRSLAERTLAGVKSYGVRTDVVLIVADDTKFEDCADLPAIMMRGSAAAAAFRDRCRAVEGAPRDVLISFGPYLPPGDVLEQLSASLRKSEMVSAVAPRIASATGGELAVLRPYPASNATGTIEEKYTRDLPPGYYLPELLLPCMLMSARMIGNIDLPKQFDHFPDLIHAFLRAGRRRGLLVRVDNGIRVHADGGLDSTILLRETEKALATSADHRMVERRLESHLAHTGERRFQAIRRPSGKALSLLLDCTGMPPAHSGSAEYMLGVLRGLSDLGDPSCDVTLMLNEEARSFFKVDAGFPHARVVSPSDRSFHDCAIRLSQAWSLTTLSELDTRARSIAVTILDTIGPDVIYAAPEEAEEAFQFSAEYADGLIYISEFSRDQFRRRFVTRSGAAEDVIRLSLSASEYVSDPASPDGEWILIFGNPYDHKDLERTTSIVSAAFPYEQIKVVGNKGVASTNVESFDSGQLGGDVIDRLFRKAKCVLFPSFYEGFGLPLVNGLSYGKTVIARRSALLGELMPRFRHPGRLVEFENSLDLVPILGKLLHGGLPAAVNRALGAGEVHGWVQCAAQILEFARRMRGSENIELWRARDRAFRYIKSAR